MKSGDRVEVVEITSYDRDAGVTPGMQGFVLFNSEVPVVRLDQKIKGGHTAGGACDDGHGWAFSRRRLKLVIA